ncbi:hypothetical protein FRC09_019573 [Ceratobasidium sp. 395]|nr:hypothetical protein FRC09_019573 [Ceratobasidium sp. 395]
MTIGAAVVQAPAVALVDEVVWVAERHVMMLPTVPWDVYVGGQKLFGRQIRRMSGAGVRMTVGASKVELEAVALVSHQVGVAVRLLALDQLYGERDEGREVSALGRDGVNACTHGVDRGASDEGGSGGDESDASGRKMHGKKS